MRWLELKVPPPLVALLCAVAMGALDRLALFPARPIPRELAIAVAIAALALLAAAGWTLWKARTTVNPMHPERATALVTRGIYRFSRNPIYLADVLVLLAWAMWLGDRLALAGVPLFMAYVTSFQIVPEERSLAARFGEPYREYVRRVRRWL